MPVKTTLYPLIYRCLLLLFIAPTFFLVPHISQAFIGYEIDLEGWAWSSTVGWISLSCENLDTCSQSDYGVTITESGNITGYAWSSNIGWIQFGNLNNFPGIGGNARITPDLQLQGWARAVSGSHDSEDGWDGWISLNCQNISSDSCDQSNFRVALQNLTQTRPLEGYAWGSTVVGWIDFSHAMSIPPPDLIVPGVMQTSAGFNANTLTYDEFIVQTRFSNQGGKPTPTGEPIEWQAELQFTDGTVLDSQQGEVDAVLDSGASTNQLSIPFSDVSIGTDYQVEVTVNPAFANGMEESDYTNNNAFTGHFELAPEDPGLSLSLETRFVRQGETARLEWGMQTVYTMECLIRGPGVNPGAENENRLVFNPVENPPPPQIITTERFNASEYDFSCFVEDPNIAGAGWTFELDEPVRLEVVSTPQEL